MNRNFLVPLACAVMSSFGSLALAQPLNNPVSDIQLIINSDDGNNGISVSWNPNKRLYYVALEGNSQSMLEIFDATGMSLFSAPFGVEIRGLNYSNRENCLIGNAYGDLGYFKIALNNEGFPNGEITKYVTGMHQPTEQSGGTMDASAKHLFFRSGLSVYKYKVSDGANVGSFSLTGISENEVLKCVNYCITYTGVKGYEFLLVNLNNAKTYFFDINGAFVSSISISYNLEIHEIMNLSFCNKHLWFYNIEEHKWTGFKIFE